MRVFLWMMAMPEAAKNTDRELWRREPDNYYSPSIHVTSGGGIGINIGGLVIVRTTEEWHALAKQPVQQPQPA